MPTCISCKQSHFGMFDLSGGICKTCRKKVDDDLQARKVRVASASAQAEVQKVWLSTETTLNATSVERLGIVTAECAFGMHAFKDLFAGVRDIVGGRSEAIQNTLRESRNVVFQEMRMEAYELGADAVIAVDLDYVELSTAGSMVLLVASGTAVRINDK